MSRHELSEIDLKEGDRRITLRRGSAGGGMSAPPSYAPMPMATASALSPVSAAAVPMAEPVKAAKPLLEIKSPMVGTFYARSKPELPSFVQVGTRVGPDTVVCLIEAMKTYNEMKAECSGVIVEVVARDSGIVEYGSVLFRVDPTA